MIREVLNGSWVALSEKLPIHFLIVYIVLTLIVEIGVFWIFLESEKFKRVAFVCLLANVVSAFMGIVILLLVS